MDKLTYNIDVFLTPFYFLVSFVDTFPNSSENIVELKLSARMINVLAGVSMYEQKWSGSRNQESKCLMQFGSHFQRELSFLTCFLTQQDTGVQGLLPWIQAHSSFASLSLKVPNLLWQWIPLLWCAAEHIAIPPTIYCLFLKIKSNILFPFYWAIIWTFLSLLPLGFAISSPFWSVSANSSRFPSIIVQELSHHLEQEFLWPSMQNNDRMICPPGYPYC